MENQTLWRTSSTRAVGQHEPLLGSVEPETESCGAWANIKNNVSISTQAWMKLKTHQLKSFAIKNAD